MLTRIISVSCAFLIAYSRLVIPMRKFLLSEEELSKPIPTLSDRQFVVQKSKLSDTEAKTQREFFWYREHLFRCIRGRWREVSHAAAYFLIGLI